MRGEEKPYEMPAPQNQQPEELQQPLQQPQQQYNNNNNNLAIQHRLQHLSPVNPQKLRPMQPSSPAAKTKQQLTSQQPAHQQQLTAGQPTTIVLPVKLAGRSISSPSPSAASTMSSGSSVTPPLPVTSGLPHTLDSLLTPAASPEDDSLETWIQTVWCQTPDSFEITMMASADFWGHEELIRRRYEDDYCWLLTYWRRMRLQTHTQKNTIKRSLRNRKLVATNVILKVRARQCRQWTPYSLR